MIILPERQDFTIYRGASFGPFTITFEESEGVPFDLTPYTEAIAKARQTKDSDDVAIEFTAEITSPPTAGIVEVSATVEDVNAPSIGDYVWDILLVRSDGGIDGPFLHGVITLENSASR